MIGCADGGYLLSPAERKLMQRDLADLLERCQGNHVEALLMLEDRSQRLKLLDPSQPGMPADGMARPLAWTDALILELVEVSP